VFEFDIESYRPQWLRGHSVITAAHGRRLRALIGRPLTHAWLAWDFQDNEWFSDCPVLFDFDGEQAEINHAKFDDLAITWNTVDPRRPVRWPGFALQWRDDQRPELRAFQGQALRDIELLVWTGRDMARGSVALSFRFTGGHVTVFNALDENGLSLGPPEPHHRRHSLR
jgi:hypothetical protein